jgi:pSer/pThr/pTyr-binding forkhead associated (FHA) protein
VVGGPSIVIGRSKNATIRVIHPLVSREHCRIDLRAEGIFIEDLGSANGTHVNGRPTKGPTRVVRGDKITLGRDGAEIVLKRAEHEKKDLLDPEEGDLATMLVGDPRAKNIDARITLGHDANERRTVEVPGEGEGEPPTPTPAEIVEEPETAAASGTGAIDMLEPLPSVVAERPQTLQPLASDIVAEPPEEPPPEPGPGPGTVPVDIPDVQPLTTSQVPPHGPRKFGAGFAVGIALGLAIAVALAVLLDLPARLGSRG